MPYDPTIQHQIPAKDIQTGTYLHHPDHPTVNIGSKVYVKGNVRLGLVTPPPGSVSAKAKHSGFTMQYKTFPPDEILSVSKLP